MKYNENPLINIEPETMGGIPVFSGTRVPIDFLFESIESEETVDEFLFNIPTVIKIQAIQLPGIAKMLLQSQLFRENIA
jgi:uncharacterized protein (DUF433 family)